MQKLDIKNKNHHFLQDTAFSAISIEVGLILNNEEINERATIIRTITLVAALPKIKSPISTAKLILKTTF